MKFHPISEMLLGLGEIVNSLVSKAFALFRGLGFIRATCGAFSLLKNPTQVFPENKFHDHHKVKQDFF